MMLDWLDAEKRIRVVTLLLVTYISYALVYITIKFALDSFPPLMLTSLRFFIAGIIFFIWSHRHRKLWFIPPLKDLKIIVIVSIAMMVIKGGFLSYSELFASSGLIATLQGTIPLWTITISWLLFKEKRPEFRVVIGTIGAAIGIVLLSVSHLSANDADNFFLALFFVSLSIFGGVFGVIYSRKVPSTMPKVKAIAYEMLLASLILVILASLTGEFETFKPEAVTIQAVMSLLVLSIIGSVVGFSAYFWVAHNASVSLASSYVYVEPIVAVAIGVIFAGEKFTDLLFFGIGIIIFSVFFIMGKKGFQN